jgi:hypothetical protein
MMRKIFLFVLFFAVCGFNFAQVSDETRQELINLYTLYAQSKTATERLQYVRNPESLRSIFESRYGNRDISFTPIRFGRAGRPVTSSDLDIYSLEETVSANQGGRGIEIIRYRYFVRVDNLLKIDWEASVCYNPVPLARFEALQDGQTAIMRCYADLTRSSYDNYFAFRILDEATNYQFTAYILKNTDEGLALLDFLENGDTRPLVLELKYVDNISRYDKKVLITKIVQRGWVL